MVLSCTTLDIQLTSMPKTALMLSFLFDLSYIAKIKFLELSISDNFVILDCITVIQFDTQTCQPTT